MFPTLTNDAFFGLKYTDSPLLEPDDAHFEHVDMVWSRAADGACQKAHTGVAPFFFSSCHQWLESVDIEPTCRMELRIRGGTHRLPPEVVAVPGTTQSRTETSRSEERDSEMHMARFNYELLAERK